MNTVNAITESKEQNNSRVLNSESMVDSSYARYVLFILLLVFMFNYIDRTIFSILAESIKHDFNLSDSDLGFLNGAAFAIFFAIFGVPFARLADSWNRSYLISIGLAAWSLMTFLSGTAKNFITLTFYRFGIGVGEACATPASHSLLYDYFSPKYRTTVLAIYGCGGSIGSGLGLFLGGYILQEWNMHFPDGIHAPFGLKGWQAAFMIMGLPGLLLSVLVFRLREPSRGQADPGNIHQLSSSNSFGNRSPIKILTEEIVPMLPFVNLLRLKQAGAKKTMIVSNVVFGLFLTALTGVLVLFTGNLVHWLALSIGIYCVLSWMQSLYLRDERSFTLIFKCTTLRYLYVSSALSIFVISSTGFWIVPYFQRQYGVPAAEIGGVLGFLMASAGISGALAGGTLADILRRRMIHGKLIVGAAAGVLWAAGLFSMLIVDDLIVAYSATFFYLFFFAMGQGPISATINDLALPQTRALAQAIYIMLLAFIGGALGPYFVGLLSDAFTSIVANNGEAIRFAMLVSLIPQILGVLLLLLAFTSIKADEESRRKPIVC